MYNDLSYVTSATSWQHDQRDMEGEGVYVENNPQIIANAHSEFGKRNFELAEELYTKFISACLHKR